MENQVNQTEEKVVKKKSYVPFIIIAAAIFVIIFLVIAIIQSISIISGSDEKKLQEQLDLGERYLQELAYEQAIVAYTAAIEIDPKSVDAYLGLADAYLGLGDVNMALDVLQDGYDETGDESLLDKIDEINESLQTSEEDGEDVAESDEIANGFPRSVLTDVSGYTIGGVHLPYLTPAKMLEMYGEYDNTYYDENLGKSLGEMADYRESYYMEELDAYHYDMTKVEADSYWSLYVEQRPQQREEVIVSGSNCEIGFADIYFGDDYDTVMDKLGFPKEQADLIKEGISNGDKNSWHCPGYETIVIEETQFNGGGGDAIAYIISISSNDEAYINDPDRDIDFCFDADFKLISIHCVRSVFPEE